MRNKDYTELEAICRDLVKAWDMEFISEMKKLGYEVRIEYTCNSELRTPKNRTIERTSEKPRKEVVGK